MKRIVKLTESDLTRIVRRVINEQTQRKLVIIGGDTMKNSVSFTLDGTKYRWYCADKFFENPNSGNEVTLKLPTDQMNKIIATCPTDLP